MKALLRLALVAIAVAGCAPERRAASPAPSPSAEIELSGAHLSEHADGRKVWELAAERVAYRNTTGVADLYGVTAGFYEDGALASRVKAPHATYVRDGGKLALDGGVRVESADAASGFEAATAAWGEKACKLTAAGGVKFWRKASELKAARLEADRGLRAVELTGGVRGKATLGTVLPLFPSMPWKTPEGPE